MVAAALVLGALGADRTLRADAEAQALAEIKAQIAAKTAPASEVVVDLANALVKKAEAAAGLRQLETLMAEKVDRPTTQDNLRGEEHWKTFRNAAETAGLIFVGDEVFASTVDAFDALPFTPLLKQAQESGPAWTVVAVGEALLLAAAAPSSTSYRGDTGALPVVAMLVRPMSNETLASVAEAAGGAVLLSDGQREFVSHGHPAQVVRLKSLVGQEASGLVTHLHGAAAAKQLQPGLWLWVFREPDALVMATLDRPNRARPVIFGVAALAALVALALAFRKPKSEPTAELLKQTREELARISQELSIGTDKFGSPAPRSTTTPHAAATVDSTVQSSRSSEYHVVDLLGEGGMARVYVARRGGAEGFQRLFVVKRLRPEMQDHREVVAQFIDEARLGASLVHSNIVPVYDFGRDAEGYYMAQEYILGRDVDALVRRSVEVTQKPLDPSVVLFIAQEALRALGYAHNKADDAGTAHHLVHRDVSPNNLIVSAGGEVKLIDFGIVKSDNKLMKTQAGVVKGNVFFMSPEQARGLEVDARSDLFSLGQVLFAAATGTTLYSGTTNYELLVKAGEGLSAADWERVEALPPALANLLKRALQFEPKDRFASAEAFAEAVALAGPASPTVMQKLMETLFRDDFAHEKTRFSKAAPT